MQEFENSSLELAAFVVSVYVLGFAAGPLVMAPFSEIWGRSPVYHACNIGFVIFVVACAKAPSLNALIVFRLFSGIFGSAPLTNGGGTIADMVTQENRGGKNNPPGRPHHGPYVWLANQEQFSHTAAMAAFSLGPLLGILCKRSL
jgi:MFS family permease